MIKARWFYEEHGSRVGPVAEEEIKGLLRSGKIGYGALVWREGAPDWVSVEKSELKGELSATPPPLARERISDMWIWLVALTPILFLVAEPRTFWACITIAWLMTIFFCAMDIINIRKAGHKSPSIWWTFFFPFVLGYLFIRSQRLKKNQAPLLVWIAIQVLPVFVPQD
ncbi:DUF4339 domain-containing protein [Pseudomonas helleri]|uniref:DUF4339 domain-containing protein n=1 Tax=Pseudomonas helleri TaxID=1608996 RepID=A0A6I1WQX0_9PSED|nr:DUF4339 domain-containing protein [Pseudomonas helleri]MQU41155.1 DUF4339 domain-containing protein [Pseudomonas helleri]